MNSCLVAVLLLLRRQRPFKVLGVQQVAIGGTDKKVRPFLAAWNKLCVPDIEVAMLVGEHAYGVHRSCLSCGRMSSAWRKWRPSAAR